MDSLKLEECEVCYMGMLERKLKLNKNKKVGKRTDKTCIIYSIKSEKLLKIQTAEEQD
jgi:hypothetical protein